MKVITNYRYWLLLVLGIVATLGVFSAPSEESDPLTWLTLLLTSKAVGLGAGYLFFHLVAHFDKNGTVPELTKFTKEF